MLQFMTVYYTYLIFPLCYLKIEMFRIRIQHSSPLLSISMLLLVPKQWRFIKIVSSKNTMFKYNFIKYKQSFRIRRRRSPNKRQESFNSIICEIFYYIFVIIVFYSVCVRMTIQNLPFCTSTSFTFQISQNWMSK